MNHQDEVIPGDLSNWFEVHNSEDGCTTQFVPNGVGQVMLLCAHCNVMQGHNEIEAGLPICVAYNGGH